MNMTNKASLVPVLAAAAVCWGNTLAAQDNDEPQGNQAAVAKAVLSARVPSSVVWRRVLVTASRFPPSSRWRKANCSSPSTR
jgi:hypothetical protein